METKFKFLIGVGITLAFATGGFFVYRNYRRKKEDDLTIDMGTVDWINRKVPYTVKLNGKFDSSSMSTWRKDLIGKGEQLVSSGLKNKIYETHLPNGFIVRGTSLDKPKFGKIVDFVSKTIKDYTGTNVDNDIASASETLKNLFI